jgi:hypothetical protein
MIQLEYISQIAVTFLDEKWQSIKILFAERLSAIAKGIDYKGETKKRGKVNERLNRVLTKIASKGKPIV